MATPTEVVTEFCRALGEGRAGLHAAIRRWFTAETVWVNTGLATTTGIEEAIALCEQLERTMGIDSLTIEFLAIAADGSKVLTERIDTMWGWDGSEVMRDPVMGIFEVAGDKIVAWRDYFDSAAALSRVK